MVYFTITLKLGINKIIRNQTWAIIVGLDKASGIKMTYRNNPKSELTFDTIRLIHMEIIAQYGFIYQLFWSFFFFEIFI